jgi:hypothetical protein
MELSMLSKRDSAARFSFETWAYRMVMRHFCSSVLGQTLSAFTIAMDAAEYLKL